MSYEPKYNKEERAWSKFGLDEDPSVVEIVDIVHEEKEEKEDRYYYKYKVIENNFPNEDISEGDVIKREARDFDDNWNPGHPEV
jgi:hypothetical protein